MIIGVAHAQRLDRNGLFYTAGLPVYFCTCIFLPVHFQSRLHVRERDVYVFVDNSDAAEAVGF